MSDYNSSLPVRTENAGDVIAKIADATIPSQQLKVEADGSINVNDNGGSITVDAVNLDIRDLVFATDKVDVTGSEVSLDAATLAALETITANQGTPNTLANAWPVLLTDGTDSVLVTAAGELSVLSSAQPGVDIGDVTINNAAGAAAVNIQDGGNSITVDAVDLDIRDLVFATDKVDVSGSTVELGATTLAALESITVVATDLDIRDLVFATDKVDVSGSTVALDAPTLAALESITVQNGAGAAAVNIQDGGNSITVDAVDLDIRDLTHVSDSVKIGDGTDFLAVNTDGSINVVIADGTPGTPINDYNTVAAVAAGATSTHSYTVTAGKTFYFNQVEASGTGKMKIEVQVNAVTKFVQFNSTANTNMSIHIENPLVATAGQVVSIIRTNRDNQAQDLYSTISGYELP